LRSVHVFEKKEKVGIVIALGCQTKGSRIRNEKTLWIG
jgi:hypothetical protein